jgi:hypothetical protein
VISSRYFRALTMVLVLGLLLMPTAVFAAEELDAVHGTVFHDLNQDGILDPGEVGILGVTIELYESDLVASTTTDADGFYEFFGLSNGSYTVKEINLANYVSTTEDEVDFDVNSPMPALTVDFGDVPVAELGSISGTVYNDLNRSRTFNEGDEGLDDVTVLLKDSEGDTLESTFTNELGFYSFDELMPGMYTIHEEDPAGYYSTTPHEVTVELEAGWLIENINFGDFVPEPGEVSPIDLPITRFFHLPLLDVLELRSIDKLGYGNIAKVYFLSYLSDWEVGDILNLLDGNGWGNVMKEVLGKPGLKGYNLGLIMSGREMPNQVSKVMEGCDLIKTQEDYQALLAVGGNQGQIKKLCKEVYDSGGTFEDLKDALQKPHGNQPVNHPGNDDNNGNGPPACKGTNKKDPGCE